MFSPNDTTGVIFVVDEIAVATFSPVSAVNVNDTGTVYSITVFISSPCDITGSNTVWVLRAAPKLSPYCAFACTVVSMFRYALDT